MKEKMKAYGRPLRRLAALAMTCVLAFTLAPGLFPQAKAVELPEAALTTVTYYEWKRVKTRNDLPIVPKWGDADRIPLLIFDKKEEDGTTTPYYFNADSDHTVIDDEETGYLHFNGVPCSEIPELAGFPDTFFTNYNPTGMTCWGAYRELGAAGGDIQKTDDDGTIDKGNANARVIYLSPSFSLGEAGWTAPYLVDYETYWDFLWRKGYHSTLYSTLVTANWSVITPDVYLKKYGADDEYKEKVNVDGGRVIMQLNLSGQDAVLDVNGKSNKIELDFWNSRNTYWRMYIGTARTYNVINTDYTVQKGQLLNLDGDIRIGDGKTITVEEGAVLSINGNIFNNGHIYNKGGTILVQSNGCIQSYLPEDKNDYGGIGLDGGDLVIRAGGRVMTGVTTYDDRWGNGLKLQNGASIINQGTLITSGNVNVNSGSTLENRKGGTMLFGYRMNSWNEGNLHHASAEDVKDPSYYYGTVIGTESFYTLKEDEEDIFNSVYKQYFGERYYYDSPDTLAGHLGEKGLHYTNADILWQIQKGVIENDVSLLYTLDTVRTLTMSGQSLIYNQGTIVRNCFLKKDNAAEIVTLAGGSLTEIMGNKNESALMAGNYLTTKNEVVPRSRVKFSKWSTRF